MFKLSFFLALAATLVYALPGQSANLQACKYVKNNRQSNCPSNHACKKVGMIGFRKELCLPIVGQGETCDKYTACEKGFKCKKQGWRDPKTCIAKKGRQSTQSTTPVNEGDGNEMHSQQSSDVGEQGSHGQHANHREGDEQGDASAAE